MTKLNWLAGACSRTDIFNLWHIGRKPVTEPEYNEGEVHGSEHSPGTCSSGACTRKSKLGFIHIGRMPVTLVTRRGPRSGRIPYDLRAHQRTTSVEPKRRRDCMARSIPLWSYSIRIRQRHCSDHIQYKIKYQQ